jgi:hypothetical protein
MITRNVLILILIISLFASHSQPILASNKFGANVLKALNQNAYFFTFPIIPFAYTYLQDQHHHANGYSHFFISMAAWYLSGSFIKITTQAIMNKYNIDPILD